MLSGDAADTTALATADTLLKGRGMPRPYKP